MSTTDTKYKKVYFSFIYIRISGYILICQMHISAAGSWISLSMLIQILRQTMWYVWAPPIIDLGYIRSLKNIKDNNRHYTLSEQLLKYYDSLMKCYFNNASSKMHDNLCYFQNLHSEKSLARPMLFYSTNYCQQFWVQFVV